MKPELIRSVWRSMTVEALTDYVDSNNINTPDDEGWTPLMLAAEYVSDPKVISVLIDKGADVHARNEDGRTALIIAAEYNTDPEVIRLLVKRGSDILTEDNYGNTALMEASSGNVPEIIQALVECGADIVSAGVLVN